MNAVNSEGTTALMLACETGQREAINVVLRAGADTSVLDTYSDTSLHKLLNKDCDQGTLQMILDHGVPLNAANKLLSDYIHVGL